jgi:hypothetical protein
MGTSTTASFIKHHPFCCFCGGSAPATTRDHQPARVFFRDREWPEGFVFPACEPCNRISAESEAALAILAHGQNDSEDRTSYRQLLKSVRTTYPGLIAGMLLTTREKRSISKEQAIPKPSGITYAELPLVRIDRKFWDPHIEMVGRKLMLALHYQCFGKALSTEGRLWQWFHFNTEFTNGGFPKEVLNTAERLAVPTRNSRRLGNQLAIRWTFDPSPPTGFFIVQLQQRLLLSGMTSENPKALDHEWRRSAAAPFVHLAVAT